MPAPDVEAQITQVKAELSSRCDDLGAIVTDTIWREVPFYSQSGRVTRAELEAACMANLQLIFDGLDSHAAHDTRVATTTGVDAAAAGVPLPVVLDVYRIGCRLVWEEIVTVAAARPDIGKEALIRATARVWLAQDVLSHTTEAGYRDEATRKVLAEEAERAALVEALIEGRIAAQGSLWEVAALLRIPARGPYVVVAAECASIGRSALPGIESRLSSQDIASAWRLLPDVQLGLVHVENDGKLAALNKTLSRLAAKRIGVSSRFDDLTHVPDAVNYARIALSAERHDGSLLAVFDADPLSIAAVSAPRIMKRISSSVLSGFDDLDERERETLFSTFRAWVAADGSINTAAEQLFCHPNTVRHRLKRIQERTGMSINRPRELAELCLAFEVDLHMR